MRKTKRMLSMLLSVVIGLFSILSHVTIVNAESREVFQDENVRLVFETTNSWDGGYQAELKLENLSDSVLNSWKIQMTSVDQINDFWGADLHVLENVSENMSENMSENVSANVSENVSGNSLVNAYEITAFSYNNQIHPGEYVSIGYIANGNSQDINDISIQYQIQEEQKDISENNVYVYEDYTVNYLITN